MLRGAGLQFAGGELDALLRHTEGWPAGLSLAAALAGRSGRLRGRARALRRRRPPGRRVRPRRGARRAVRRRAAVRQPDLGPRGADRPALRRRARAVRARPTCWRGSGGPASRSSRSTARPSASGTIACSAEMLRADLHRCDPALEAELHQRACAWHAAAGDRERALRHALAAGRAGPRRRARLERRARGGRAWRARDTVEHSLSRFTAPPSPPTRCSRWPPRARSSRTAGPTSPSTGRTPPSGRGGADVAGAVAVLTAALGRDGLGQDRAPTATARRALLAPDSPGQALAALLAGVVAYLDGDRDDGARAARGRRAPCRGAGAAAPRAVPRATRAARARRARRRGRPRGWPPARARRSPRHGLARLETSALVLAVSALVRPSAAASTSADADAREAAALLARMVDIAPWYELEVHLALTRTALRLSDVNEARAHLAAAQRVAAREPEAVVGARGAAGDRARAGEPSPARGRS